MKAVVYKGPFKVAVEDVEDARIAKPTDAIVRITTSGVCGSDMHMYEGRTSAKPGLVFGHEPLGIVEEIGPDVNSINQGDRVVLPFNISCGYCYNCIRGYYNACLTSNPDAAGAAYGYVGLGPHRGAQAEFVRVPFADFNCTKLPGEEGDEFEDDFVALADIFPTGYHATELAGVQPGGTVAVFGAGPVGLMAAYSAILKGASEVYVVDHLHDRLEKAEEIGAIPVDFAKGDPVEQIVEIRKNTQPLVQAMRPGEDKMLGVMHGIDAVGYEGMDRNTMSGERPSQVIEDLVRLINPTGMLGIVGVYLPQDPEGVDEHAQQGQVLLPLGEIFDKGLSIGTGQAIPKQYHYYLRDLIIAGKAKPGFVMSHHVPLSAAPEAYEKFDKKEAGYTKVLINPGMAA